VMISGYEGVEQCTAPYGGWRVEGGGWRVEGGGLCMDVGVGREGGG
jgi:hypothetical protein